MGDALKPAWWLLKTEPATYSFADLAAAGKAQWDGVSNPAACGHLRACRVGDLVLIYHTGEERAIVGLGRVTSAAVEDPKRPGRTAKGEIKFPVIGLEAVAAAERPFTLAEMKDDAQFAGWELVTQAQLSVMPVPVALATIIRKAAGL